MNHQIVMSRHLKRMRTLLYGVFIVGLLVIGLSSPVSVSADIEDTACQGFNEALGTGSCGGGGGDDQVGSTLATVVNILSIVVGVIAVFMIIIAGIRYITSNGDPGAAKSARDTVIYAIIGLMIVSLAQIIVRFVLSEVGDTGTGGGGGGGGGAPPAPGPGGGPF